MEFPDMHNSTPDKHPGPECECEICKNEHAFKMPSEVVDACENDRLVVFAGAGISTESRTVLQNTLYERIAAELAGEHPDESFPDLMSRYVQEKGRRLLLQRIKERLDYIDAFPELHRAATRFHRELATLFYISDIVTTNWDAYFELETGALPLVTDKDFALWDLPGRKVFKIHGSIYNLGSIVATHEDYERCYRALNRNVLGATLKHLLATKTILFVGYSFGDSDFNRIYRFIANQMADVLPRSYIVTLGDPRVADTRGAHVIATDATFFVRKLKEELLDRGCLVDDERWHGITPRLFDVLQRHDELYEKVDVRRLPAAVLCGHYQDGLIHAFERMLEQRRTGEYSHTHRVERLVAGYEERRKELVKAKRYHDATYATGYQNGLMYLIADDATRKMLPLYFVYGSSEDLRSLTAFRRVAKTAQELHKQAYAQAARIAQKWGPGVVPHHRPEL
jgi:NAD-dependent SIR2 family protein deacetylase